MVPAMRNPATWLPALLLVAACGGGGSGDDGSDVDAAASSVTEVSCAGADIAATVTTTLSAYTPADTTINVGEIVEFHPAGAHDVAVDGNAFHVDFGADKCFQFDAAATYTFRCSVHGFTGTLTVQ